MFRLTATQEELDIWYNQDNEDRVDEYWSIISERLPSGVSYLYTNNNVYREDLLGDLQQNDLGQVVLRSTTHRDLVGTQMIPDGMLQHGIATYVGGVPMRGAQLTFACGLLQHMLNTCPGVWVMHDGRSDPHTVVNGEHWHIVVKKRGLTNTPMYRQMKQALMDAGITIRSQRVKDLMSILRYMLDSRHKVVIGVNNAELRTLCREQSIRNRYQQETLERRRLEIEEAMADGEGNQDDIIAQRNYINANLI